MDVSPISSSNEYMCVYENHCENVCILAYVHSKLVQCIQSNQKTQYKHFIFTQFNVELSMRKYRPKIYSLTSTGSWAKQNAHKHKKMRQVLKKYGFKL